MASVANGTGKLNPVAMGLDQLILDRAVGWGRVAYRAVLEWLDGVLKQGRDRSLRVIHRRRVRMRTCLGIVGVTRTQYRDQAGRYRYLLDEALGMEKYRHLTATVIEKALELAVQMPFRRSAEVLEHVGRVVLSHESIRRWVGRLGDRLLKQAEAEVQALLSQGVLPASEGRKTAHLLTEADGVMVSQQRQKSCQAEVKVGIAYEGWQKVGKDRYATVEKTIFGGLAEADHWWAGMLLKLHGRYDLARVQHVGAGGDGAPWVKQGAAVLGGRFSLDTYHLCRELRGALGPRHPALGAILQACNRGDVISALEWLSTIRVNLRGEAAQRLDQVARYLWQNRDGLRDYRLDLREEGHGLRRMGAIEGNVDKLVAKRMKRQGMSWTPHGITTMIAVRFLFLEGKLGQWLRAMPSAVANNAMPDMKPAGKAIGRILRQERDAWLKATLPALQGPHASRPWVQALKSLSEVPA